MNNQEARILLSSLLLKMPDRGPHASSAHRRECDFIGRLAGDVLTGLPFSLRDAEWLSDLYRSYVGGTALRLPKAAEKPVKERPKEQWHNDNDLLQHLKTRLSVADAKRQYETCDILRKRIRNLQARMRRAKAKRNAPESLPRPVIEGGPFS